MLSQTLTLNGRRWTIHQTGDASGPAMLLLHGFTGSGRNWDELAKKLPGWRIIAPDLPGHGETAAPTDAMPEVARDLAALLDQLGLDQVVLIGYSMGGRLALHFAVQEPQRVRGLVIIGATPGLQDAEARAARVAADEQLAQRIEADFAGFVSDWEAQSMFATQKAMSHESQEHIRAIRRSHHPKALAAALRRMGTGAQPPLHGQVTGLTMPVLWVVGEYDQKFRAIAESVQPLLPSARFAILPYAGHAVHLERPSAFKTLLLSFTETLPDPAPPRRSDA